MTEPWKSPNQAKYTPAGTAQEPKITCIVLPLNGRCVLEQVAGSDADSPIVEEMDAQTAEGISEFCGSKSFCLS